MDNPPTVVSPQIILLLTNGRLPPLAPHNPAICSPQTLFPHLHMQEQLELTAVLHNAPRPTKLPFHLADYQHHPIHTLPHAMHHTLALANGLTSASNTLLLIHLGDGLSQPAQQQLRRQIHAAQKAEPRLLFLAASNLDSMYALADEVWQIEKGNIAHKWKTAVLPPHLTPAAQYTLTFSSPKTAVSFHKTINTSPRAFGLLHNTISTDDPRTLTLSVDNKKRIASLVRTAGYDLVTFRTMGNEQGTMGNEQLTIDGCPLAADTPSLSGAIAIAQSEWRRHFRGFWRGANVLLSNILLLGMALGTLQTVDQMPTANWLLMLGVTLLMAAAMPIGWGVEAMYQWRKKRNGISYAQTLPLAPLTLWGGLVGGQALILLTHTAVFLTIMTAAFADNPAFIFTCALFGGVMALNGLTLIPLLARIPHTTGQAWGIGWGAFAAIIFSGAALNRIPAAYWPLTWLWPFTADLTALAQSTTTTLPHLIIPIIFSLLTTILWGWIGIRSRYG